MLITHTVAFVYAEGSSFPTPRRPRFLHSDVKLLGCAAFSTGLVKAEHVRPTTSYIRVGMIVGMFCSLGALSDHSDAPQSNTGCFNLDHAEGERLFFTWPDFVKVVYILCQNIVEVFNLCTDWLIEICRLSALLIP